MSKHVYDEHVYVVDLQKITAVSAECVNLLDKTLRRTLNASGVSSTPVVKVLRRAFS